MANKIKEEEFIDGGLTFIRETYDDGRKHIKNKVGEIYPVPVNPEPYDFEKEVNKILKKQGLI